MKKRPKRNKLDNLLNKEDILKCTIQDAFENCFKIGDEILFRRQTDGNILTGRILNVGDLRFRVENLRTKKRYWVEYWWLV